MTVSIRVVIVNFNAGETLSSVVRSALESDQKVRVTVHDNASTDGSLELLQQTYAGFEQLDVVPGDENIGFSRAVNAVARNCTEDYLLILNPDCELFPGALEKLVTALEHDPGAALAGPLVVDSRGLVQRGTLRNFPDPWNSLVTLGHLSWLGKWFTTFRGVEGDPPRQVGQNVLAEAVSGACMLVRRRQFVELGGLDEGYGLHCEDLDLMYRFHQAGFHCLLVSDARVCHQQGTSSRSRPAWVHRQKHRGMQRFFNKFQADRYGLPMRWLVTAGIWLRYAVTLPVALLKK